MKVLIISHNPITSYHNMGKTLQNLFCKFSKEELCQLYCYPTLPDIEYCSSYFRITDRDVLKSYYSGFRVRSRQIEPEEIRPDNTLYENPEDRASYNVTQDYKRILRDIMWKCARWYNRELKQWLSVQNPDCIFVAPGDACFLYDIAGRISAELDIPIVSYICDDYFFVSRKSQLCSEVRSRLLKRKIAGFLPRVSHCIYICGEMQELYTRRFGIPGTLLMTGADHFEQQIHSCEALQVITYMGNVRCNRYHSLAKIGEVLDRINAEKQTDLQLHIYSDEKDLQINRVLERAKSVKRFGFLKGAEYKNTFLSSQLLLHTEAFDDSAKELVKNSVSTKIAESLASGIPVFAFGPESVASMGHLIRNDCAITATSEAELYGALMTALFDKKERIRVAENGLKTAHEFHDAEKNGKIIRSIIQKSCRKNKPAALETATNERLTENRV